MAGEVFRMLKRILTAVLMLFVLLVVNSAGASNTVRIAYSDIDNFVGIKDGRLAGYGVALFDAIAEHTGWTYEYKSGSWEQCLEWVKNGEADFTFPAQYSEQRAVDFLFSRQNCILDFAAIYTSGTNSDILYQDYQSLQGKRLGMIKGNYLNLCFDKFVGSKGISVQKFYYSSGAEVNEALAAGKIDAIMSGNCVLDEDKKLVAYLGWEQEYFLVDEGLYAARPDLLMTGRTLMGHDSAKNQQLEDHYFGAIPSRVAAFMKELEIEALKLGIPVKTRHNEVAPNQFELAPVFEECNLAVDHNMLIMALMRKVARNHGFRVLLHEKPFKGVNGSGKHNNWSLGTDTGILLHAPGKLPEENLRFITFVVNTLMAVYRHNGLLKASISSATNAHRLGANEAPPAIISSFLGKQLSQVLEHIEESTKDDLVSLSGKQGMKLDIPQIPELMIDNTDRNRTSPFAFTGNRFEFRAVGSEANCASAMIALNSALAEQLVEFKKDVDELIEKGEPKISAILEVIRRYIKVCKPIHFDGNGYSDEWKAEAARRGLDCETSVPVIFDNYLKPESIRMFESIGVMTKKELEARNEVKWEMYTKKIQIEARVLGDLAMNHIIPVATQYQSDLIDNVYKMKDLFPAEKAAKLSAKNLELIEEIADRTAFIKEHVDAMIEARKVANKIESEREKAIAYHDNIVPMMEEIRYHIDKLELIVDNQMWTLPKYRELLFIR